MKNPIDYENLAKLNASFHDEYVKAFSQSLNEGQFILGKNVSEFEKEFANYCGTSHCLGLASGLDALILALKALDLPKKSEVLVPSNTYIATILAIVQNGFTPILVEPDPDTCNISPQNIANKITSNSKALIIVHLYGQICEMDEIQSLCKRFDLKLIEDCAQSHGATYKNKKAGTFGDINAFSFYPTKNLGALGDGGAITTNNQSYFEKIKVLRNYGSKIKYYNEVVGYNSRLDEIQASFLRIKLRSLDHINQHKKNLATIYNEKLTSIVTKPKTKPNCDHVYHIYNIRTEKRDELREFLLSEGIKTEIHYPVSPNKQKALQDILPNNSTPISEEIHRTTLSLPISYFHRPEDIETVCQKINLFFN
jgi:dTDP-4-amino-4,6-dideoxygalactose transaminase